MVVAIETDLRPEPLSLAQRLWAAEQPVLLWTRDASGPSFVACDPTDESGALDPEPELPLDPSLGTWGGAPRWVGVLPYEAERARLERPTWSAAELRPSPMLGRVRWLRYPAVAVISDRVTVVGDAPWAVRRLIDRLRAEPRHALECEAQRLAEPDDEEQHRARVLRALEHIAAGDVYQVNLARCVRFVLRGSPLGALRVMSRAARAPYCAALSLRADAHGDVAPALGPAAATRPADAVVDVVSTSPELFLRLWPNGRVVTEPIKGTRPRGVSASDDRRQLHELSRDPKEQAELMMVVDIERNDLGRVARVGSVVAEPPRVRRHGTVFHRHAQVSARLLPGLGRRQLLEATLPSGSVTGAPKVRAMELIARLESERRGLYTGALGFVSHDGGMHLSMAIRTLCRRGELAHYHVGGGIVYDSDVRREVQETQWKAAQLLRLFE